MKLVKRLGYSYYVPEVDDQPEAYEEKFGYSYFDMEDPETAAYCRL
jgi:hypothetical protein